MSARRAQIVCEAVAVLCPYCGESQPRPGDDGNMWEPHEVRENQGRRECVSCERKMLIATEPKARIEY